MPHDFCVPQGSVLGSALYILYTIPLTKLMLYQKQQHSICHKMFTDNTQLHHSEFLKNYSDLVHSLQDCVKDIGLWTEENKLELNNDKIEAIRFLLSSNNTTLPHPQTISLSNTDADFAGFVRSRGFIFDLLMKPNIIKTCKAA